MILSTLGFALMGICVKFAGQSGIPLLEIVAARALVSLVLSFVDIKRKNIPVLGQNKLWLILRGVIGTFALICVYYAVLNMPFAEATVIQYLNPLFVAVMAAMFLGEKFQKITLVAIVLSMFGLVLIVQPAILFGTSETAWPLMTAFIALLGAIGSAVAYVIVRKLSATEDVSVIILYFPLVALPLSLLLLGSDFVMPKSWDWLLLLLIGIFTQLGQWGLTKSIQMSPAGKAMSFSYMQIVFALLLGLFFFAEIPNAIALTGMFIVVISTMMSIASK